MTINDIVKMESEDIANYCDRYYFNFPILESVENSDDLKEASRQMGILMGYHAFLASMLSHLKYMIREEKKNGNKEMAADLIDKKTIIEYAFEVVKQHYTCLSRRVTIHKDVMAELGMSDCIKK